MLLSGKDNSTQLRTRTPHSGAARMPPGTAGRPIILKRGGESAGMPRRIQRATEPDRESR